MATISRRLRTNVAGQFFVDSSCIDCDACRQLSPTVFAERNGCSAVISQPSSVDELAATKLAVIACPTGSIGADPSIDRKDARNGFPLLLDGPVYYTGYNSSKSYGGNPYFIQHPEGNWLVDSPRYSPYLVQRFEELGGIKYIFLTHRDDVADVAKYAKHFGSTRIIHYYDKHAQPNAELLIKGTESFSIGDFTIIPTPGHTKGHMCCSTVSTCSPVITSFGAENHSS